MTHLPLPVYADIEAAAAALAPVAVRTRLLSSPALDAQTAMPNVRVSADDARDIAAYLYTLN